MVTAPRRRPGRPRIYAGNYADRKRAAMRSRRPGGDVARAAAELRADPSGATWSRTTRRVFATEADRLARRIAG